MAPMMMQQPFLGGLGVQPIYRPQYVPQPQQTMPTQVKRWEKGNNGWWYDKDGNDVLAIWNQDTNQYHLRVNGR